MPSVDLRDVSGARTGSVTLDDTVFGIQPNVPVLHQVVTAQLAAARSGTQSTKTRAEVSGGGRKPFKQKGTGRARQGSERAPHFTGGGIALGPKPRSYKQRTPRKMIQLALRSALSDRASEGKVVVVEGWPWDVPSTKDARSALGSLELDGKVLVVLSRDDEDAYKSFRNLPDVQLILTGELNAYDVLCNDWVLFTRETLPGNSPIDQTVSPSPTAAPPERAAAPAESAAAPDVSTETTAVEPEGPAAETDARADGTEAVSTATDDTPEPGPTDMGPTDVGPTEVAPTDVGPTEVAPTDEEPGDE